MNPNPVFLGMDFYTIFSAIGIICCVIVLKTYITRKQMPNKYFNFYLVVSLFSILIGYLFAGIFQSIFDFIETGKMNFLNDGITFFGGLTGGALAFILIYNLLGRIIFKSDKTYRKYFYRILAVAPSCVTIAHAFGRIGCLFAGCCHGAIVEAGHGGIWMWCHEIHVFAYAIPIQLYEAIFLFALFAVTTVLYFKKIHCEAEVYCISYSVWRFIIEFFRGDDRGKFIGWLTPSQGFSILFFIAGIAIICYKIKNKRINMVSEE